MGRDTLLQGLPARYVVRRHLADGGMGSVWCAQDLILGRRVAIKLLSERFAGDDQAIIRFKREARAAAQLSSHPHVVTIYDVGETGGLGEAGGLPFIVMEYLSGGTVGDALRVGEFTRADALRWIAEAARVLDHAHSRGVIHRDIKPANLLLDGQRTLHIGDFGIAFLAGEGAGHPTELLGTAAYLAPEQLMGSPGSAASDRYALGVVAFELLTGTRPFGQGPPGGDGSIPLGQEPILAPAPCASALDPSLPSTVDAVLTRAMAGRSADRWPTATAFAEALRRAVQADPAVAQAATVKIPVVSRSAASAPPRAAATALESPLRRLRGGRRRGGVAALLTALAAILAAATTAIATATATTGVAITPARGGAVARGRTPAPSVGDQARLLRRRSPPGPAARRARP